MPQLKDDELSKVNGGVGVGYDWATGILTIDFLANPDLTVENAYSQYAPSIQVMGDAAMAAFNQVMNTYTNHKNITKCEVALNGFVITYYIGEAAYTQQQVDAMPVQQ